MLLKLIDTPADPVRWAFLHVFEPREGMTQQDGSKGKDKYELTAIIEPGGDNAKRAQEAIIATAKEKYGEKMVKDDDNNDVPAWKYVPANLDEDRKGLRKGNSKRDKSGAIYPGFEGKLFITARNETRPTVIDRQRSPLTARDGVVYAGCYGTVHIDVWGLKKQGVKPSIVATLTGCQFTRDGDAFGSGATVAKADDFDSLDADEPSSGGAMSDDDAALFD